jgi:hypothetical protein
MCILITYHPQLASLEFREAFEFWNGGTPSCIPSHWMNPFIIESGSLMLHRPPVARPESSTSIL